MSVTVSLYIPNKDVSYVTGNQLKIKPSIRYSDDFRFDYHVLYWKLKEEAEDRLGHVSDEEIIKYIDKKMEDTKFGDSHFSDYGDHEIITLYNHPMLKKKNGRCKRYIDSIKEIFPDYIQRIDYSEDKAKYIVVDTVCYRQGWWFKKKLFKSKFPRYQTMIKEKAIEYMREFFDFNYKAKQRSFFPSVFPPVGLDDVEYYPAKVAFEAFCKELDKLQDFEFIFVISW